MSPRDVTDPAAVRAATREFDAIGRATFLERYGFGEARRYFLVLDGKQYDSKAILSVAHAYQHGTLQAGKKFNGGKQTTGPLKRMGFEVTK